jgi:hypothetical protein
MPCSPAVPGLILVTILLANYSLSELVKRRPASMSI